MSSILTNQSAITAVANLAATQKSLSSVQNEISTGLKVSSAKDNAAYYSIATTLRTQIGNLSAASDSLNLGQSVVATATAATNNVTSILQSIQKDLVSASQPGIDLGSLQTAITTLRSQLTGTVSTASFNGVNLLDGSNPSSVQFVAGVTGTGANTQVNTLSIGTSTTNLSGSDYVTGTNALANAAVTADANAAQAKSNYTQLLSKFTSDVGALVAGDVADATTTNGTTAFKAIFGAAASISSGVVSGIVAGSEAAQLLGTTGSITLSTATPGTITSYTGATGGAIVAYLGAGATATTTAATAATGSLAKLAYTADTAAANNAAAYPTYLVDNAVTTANTKATALSAYTTAKSAFTTAVGGLSSSDLANGASTAAFQSVFGSSATIANGVVTGIAAGSVAAGLIGTGGSYTISGGSYTTSGTTATAGGALYSLYGTGSSSNTTDATATGGASKIATDAANAVNSNAAASTIYNGALFSVSQIDVSHATPAQIATYIKQVGAALSAVNTASETLGAASTNIDLQSSYTSSLSDSLTTGVGSLVDADLNEASTRLNALQTQQQLGVQALSVANQNSQLILKLFQG